MKEGIKFGVGCFIGMTVGVYGLAILSGFLDAKSEKISNNEKGGKEES